jgi:ribosomal protein S18 acetylase RimI-like enzyme
METDLSDKSSVLKPNALVRFATYTDLPRVAHIARVTWDSTYSQTIAAKNRQEFLERAYAPENLVGAINGPGHWFYVAEVDGNLVGFGHFLRRYHRSHARAELVRLYVLPDYQDAGIGTSILKTGFAALATAKIEECFVSVQASNTRARKFYERHGFVHHRDHGQFLGTQIITLVEYVRPITETDMVP